MATRDMKAVAAELKRLAEAIESLPSITDAKGLRRRRRVLAVAQRQLMALAMEDIEALCLAAEKE